MARTWMAGIALVGVGGLLLAGRPAFGETYRWIDRDGVVRYTDRPPQPSELAPAPATMGSTVTPAAVSATMQELMELSGLNQQLQWMATSTRSQIQIKLGALDADERAAVDRVVAGAYAAERLQALVHEAMGPRVHEANLGQVLAWYRTAAGRKIMAAETVAAMPQAQAEIAAFARARATHPTEPARVERLRRLDAAAGASEFTFDVIVAVAEGLRRGVEPFMSVERRRALAGANREVAEARPRAVEQLRATLLVNSEFVYRDVSDGELDAYLGFLTSLGGRWFTTEIHRALLHAMRASTEEAIVAIADVVPPHLWGRSRPRPVPAPRT